MTGSAAALDVARQRLASRYNYVVAAVAATAGENILASFLVNPPNRTGPAWPQSKGLYGG